jgi:hypothetical protein
MSSVAAQLAYSLGRDRDTFGGVLCVKEMPLAASQHWSANEDLLIEAPPISQHPPPFEHVCRWGSKMME